MVVPSSFMIVTLPNIFNEPCGLTRIWTLLVFSLDINFPLDRSYIFAITKTGKIISKIIFLIVAVVTKMGPMTPSIKGAMFVRTDTTFFPKSGVSEIRMNTI